MSGQRLPRPILRHCGRADDQGAVPRPRLVQDTVENRLGMVSPIGVAEADQTQDAGGSQMGREPLKRFHLGLERN